MNWYEAMQEARAHGISRKAMAAEMGIHPHTLARWERDERSVAPAERAGYDGILRRQVTILEQQKIDKTGGGTGDDLADTGRPPGRSLRAQSTETKTQVGAFYKWAAMRSRHPSS